MSALRTRPLLAAPQLSPSPREQRHLQLVWSRPEPLARHVYRRRRLIALVASFVLVAAVYGVVQAEFQQSSQSPSTPLVPASSGEVRVVEPGDTLWSIASASVGPGTDVRPIVAEMSDARNGRPLMPGDRVHLP